MFSDSLIITAKEFRNLFKSRRTLIMTFGLPLLLFPLLFFGIGTVERKKDLDRQSRLYYVEFRNFDDSLFRPVLAKYLNYQASDQGVGDQSIMIIGEGNKAEIRYNSSSGQMAWAADQAEKALREYNDMLADDLLRSAGLTREDLTVLTVSRTDIASDEAREGELLAVFIPYVLILFMLIGAMSLVLDVTAGEKERGTIAVLLVNQVSRSSIALGKTIYVIVCSILNSFSSVGGMALGFFILTGSAGSEIPLSLSFFTPLKVLQLLLVLVSVSAVVSSLMVYFASLARNLKEGGSYVMPLYMLGLFAVVITMNMDAADSLFYYFVPLVNGVFVMKSLLTGVFPPVEYLVCLAANLAATGLFVYRTGLLYNSERVLKTV